MNKTWKSDDASKTVLFIDDDDQFLNVLAMRAEQMGLTVKCAHNLLSAMSIFAEAQPDLVCIDVNLPSGNGLNMCELIQRELESNSIPLIVLSGQCDEQTLDACQTLNARFIKKAPDVWHSMEASLNELLELDCDPNRAPVNPNAGYQMQQNSSSSNDPAPNDIVDAVFAILGADVDYSLDEDLDGSSSNSIAETQVPDSTVRSGIHEHRPWVLLIEDDQDVSLALKIRLENSGIAVARAFEGLEGVKEAFSRPAEAIILDFNLPNGQGDYVLRRLKSNPVTRDIPVIVVTGVRDQSLEQKMLSLGACRFFTKPIDFDCLMGELNNHVVLQSV